MSTSRLLLGRRLPTRFSVRQLTNNMLSASSSPPPVVPLNIQEQQASMSRHSNNNDKAATTRPRASNGPLSLHDSARGVKTSSPLPSVRRVNQRLHQQQQSSQQQQQQQQQQRQRQLPPNSLLADHLAAGGERVTDSGWIQIENIPPQSSLEAMMAGVNTVLEQEWKERGIVDLDAIWNPGQPVPFLTMPSSLSSSTKEEEQPLPQQNWIQQARVVLSSFGRPTGWYLQLANRSLAYALLMTVQPIQCAWKQVKVSAVPLAKCATIPLFRVDECTVRVENCPPDITPMQLINLFSRFDLKGEIAACATTTTTTGRTATATNTTTTTTIEQWHVQQSPSSNVPITYLIHFATPAWARAAVREKQGHVFRGRELRLAQYPKQLLSFSTQQQQQQG